MPKFKAGDCFYKKNDSYKYHIVTILEDEGQIVYKYFGKYKQWWHYEIEDFDNFQIYFKIGLYYFKDNKND